MTPEMRFYLLLPKAFGFIFAVMLLLTFLCAMYRREAVNEGKTLFRNALLPLVALGQRANPPQRGPPKSPDG
jgi:hypothetical protein